jgi:hypothetical protein
MPIRNTDMTDLIEEKIALQEQNEALLGQLKWYHAITSILVELEGGVVKLPKNVVEGYDLSGNVRIYEDAESLSYVVEIVNE